MHIAYTAEQSWAALYHTWLLIELMPKGVVFSFIFGVSQLNKLACHHSLDQQLLFPHHHPNDHTSQENLYKIHSYRVCLIQKTIQCYIMSILVDLLLLSRGWISKKSMTDAAAKCDEAAQALSCFGHLGQTIPPAGLGSHSA